jgi:hypothetical protein
MVLLFQSNVLVQLHIPASSDGAAVPESEVLQKDKEEKEQRLWQAVPLALRDVEQRLILRMRQARQGALSDSAIRQFLADAKTVPPPPFLLPLRVLFL